MSHSRIEDSFSVRSDSESSAMPAKKTGHPLAFSKFVMVWVLISRILPAGGTVSRGHHLVTGGGQADQGLPIDGNSGMPKAARTPMSQGDKALPL